MDAAPRGIIGHDLWQKLINADVIAWARAAEDEPWEYRMPERFLAYVRERAGDRGLRTG
jgi:hypothetical protein